MFEPVISSVVWVQLLAAKKTEAERKIGQWEAKRLATIQVHKRGN